MVRARTAHLTACFFLFCSYLWVHPSCAYTLSFNGSTTPMDYPGSQAQYGIEIFALRLGLDAGAIIDMEISLKPKDTVAVLAVYSYIQIVNMLQSTSFKRTVYPSTARYEITGTTTMKVQLPSRNRYYIALLTAPNAGNIGYAGSATFLNPSSRKHNANVEQRYTHLAVEDYYLPKTSYLMLALFLCLSAFWAWRIRPSRIRMYPIQHMFLVKHTSAAILTQVVNYILASVYYCTYESFGWVDSTLQTAQGITAVTASGIFLLLILLTSMGYTVSRMFLTLRERQLLSLAFASHVGFSTLYATCSTSNDVCMSFYLGIQVVKFLVTFAVILQLHNQIDLVRDACQAQHATSKSGLDLVLAGYRKLRTLTRFRWVILFYLAIPVAFLFTSFSFLSWVDEKWLPAFAESISVWFVLLTMVIAVSPGPSNLLDGAPLPNVLSDTNVYGTEAGTPLENMSGRRPSELRRAQDAERAANDAVRIAMLAAYLGNREAIISHAQSNAIERSGVVNAVEEENENALIRAMPTLEVTSASDVPKVQKKLAEDHPQ